MLHDQGCHSFVAIVISFKFVFVLFLLKFGKMVFKKWGVCLLSVPNGKQNK